MQKQNAQLAVECVLERQYSQLEGEHFPCGMAMCMSMGNVQWVADGCWFAALSFGLTWEAQADKPALGSYYLDLGDKLNAVCPSCIFLLEGTGQSKFLGVDWCHS